MDRCHCCLLADINECLDGNGDCEHKCINELGTYRCACKTGFILRSDNRTCEPDDISSGGAAAEQAAHRTRCFANCDTVLRLHNKIEALEEKVRVIINRKLYLDAVCSKLSDKELSC